MASVTRNTGFQFDCPDFNHKFGCIALMMHTHMHTVKAEKNKPVVMDHVMQLHHNRLEVELIIRIVLSYINQSGSFIQSLSRFFLILLLHFI